MVNARQACTRRGFLQAVGAGFLASLGRGARGAETAASEIPVAIPIGYLASRGRSQAKSLSAEKMGALLALDEANVLAGLFGKKFALLNEETDSDQETAALARYLIEDRHVAAIISNLDTQSTKDIGALTQELRTPFFNCASPSNILRGKHGHRFSFHTVPSESMYLQVVGDWLLEEKTLTNWFVLNDSSEAGRSASAATKSFLKSAHGTLAGALEIPSHNMNMDFKPVLNSIGEKKPEVLFLCLQGDVLHRFLEQFIEMPLPLQLAGATLNIKRWWNAPSLPAFGSIWPTAWHYGLFRYSARELNSRFTKQFDESMETSAWANWSAVKLITEAIIRTGITDGDSLVGYLENQTSFDGHKGIALTFSSRNHQLAQPLYLVTPRKTPGERPLDIFEVMAPVDGIKMYRHVDPFDKMGESEQDESGKLEPF